VIKDFFFFYDGKKITSRIFVESKGRFYETDENFFFGRQVRCMVDTFNEVSKTFLFFIFFLYFFFYGEGIEASLFTIKLTYLFL
jgi:hypothetical protein